VASHGYALGFGGYQMVYSPFRRVPTAQRLQIGTEPLLNPGAAAGSSNFWVHAAGILPNFAKQALAIDQLQPPTPQRAEFQPQPCELLLLNVCHHPNDVRL
jgi:hypothetical protein